MLAQLKADFPDDLRVVYRHYPLVEIHDKAALATQAAEAAAQQGMFWEMHDVLYQRQAEWNLLSTADFTDWLAARAGELGMDTDQFQAALTSAELTAFAQNAVDQANELGIPFTPFILINGRIYDGPRDYANLSTIVKLFALQERQYETCPPMVINPDREYFATIETEKGNIVIQLRPDLAPLAVNNFVFLATEGWYDNVTFHRVLDGFMAQAGDPTGTGYGSPGYAFVNETSSALFDSEGVLAMANSGPDTNGSQFFITFAPAMHLNGGYTIFGYVIEGMDVLNSLSLRDPSAGLNQPPGDEILTVTIQER